MSRIQLPALAAAAASLALMAHPAAATTALVNFDPPGMAQGPSTYVAAGAQQTINTAPATFSGGVVLGFATFFPAISFATPPNVYGTADFGLGLSRTLDIAVNPLFGNVNQISFALFNGETFAQSYTATAYNGATQVAVQTLSNIAANFNSGYALVDLQAPTITNVKIAAVGNPAVWDFLIDTVAFNQTAQAAVNGAPPPVIPPPPIFTPPPPVTVVDDEGNEIELELNYGDSNDGRNTLNSLRNQPVPINGVPEPATWAMMLLGFGGMGAVLRRRRAAAHA